MRIICKPPFSDAFDYFILQFAIHGTRNLHKTSPAAMAVNNENTMTVYFNLVADFLCNFLPNDPSSVVYPQIDLSPLKSSSSTVQMPMTPMRQPRYLLLSSLSHQMQNSSNPPRDVRLQDTTAANRSSSSNWRSETIMMFFIDCWLRNDMDECGYDVPSNEFIRILRILVKQLHYFGNCAELDCTSLAALRQQSQNLLNARMYSFLKSVMSRWPLDTSFLNVLELWLSYIQPWRYVYNRNIQNLNSDVVDVPDRFKTFMNENLLCYTQIFVRLIPRFLKMDLSLSKNAFMLFRMLKVFRQSSHILREMERVMMSNNTGIRSPHTSGIHETPRTPNNSMNRSGDRFSMHRFASQSALFDDSTYVCMFSDDTTLQIYELMQRVYAAKLKTNHEVTTMEKQLQQNTTLWERFLELIGWLSSLSFSFSQALEEKKKAPYYLDFILEVLSPMYSIPIEDTDFTANESVLENSDTEHNDKSVMNITPSFMRSQLSQISYTGDPELLPIMSSEIKILVRLLYRISKKVNKSFEREFNSAYERDDILGRFARQILTAPVEARTFDKSAGFAELQVKNIGARLSLRRFARMNFYFLMFVTFIFGRIFFGASSVGFMTLITVTFLYLCVKALFSA
jgi:sphingomyelin phosphodiesterase 4